MQDRYVLRFESGDRAGETVPISSRGATLGRRPGSSVQILDASVSGRHAEISIDDDGVLLRDLGSTNGTRVGKERVSEQRLAHGDLVTLGNIEMTFLDRDLGEEPPVLENAVLAASTGGAAEAAGEDVHTISADKVTRSRKKPLAALLGLLVVAGGAGAAWYFLGAESAPGKKAAVQPVEPRSGDLLAAGFSFESERGGWSDDERSPAGFEADPDAARSGELGLRARLGSEEGAWSLSNSPEVRVPNGRTLVARGWVRCEDGAEGLLGVELSASSGAVASVVAWSPAQTGAAEVELTVEVPPVYDRARALLLARLAAGAQGGRVDADDISLVAESASGAARPRLGEAELFTTGTLGTLFKIDRVLIGDIAVREGGAEGDPAGRRVQLSGSGESNGVRVAALGSGGGERVLGFFVEPGQAEGGLASTGVSGYRTHQVEFEREDADSLLCGSGRDLVRVVFDQPARITGRPEGSGFRVEAELGAAAGALLQLSFREEKDAAEGLARDARAAEREGRFGEAIASWQTLLDRYPFEAELVADARAGRSRMEQAGLEEVRELGREVERARFFRLVDLFRRCLASARDIVDRYAPSEVAVQAAALAEEIEGDVAQLERELDSAERERLARIEAALRAGGSERLADRVQERLAARFGEGGR